MKYSDSQLREAVSNSKSLFETMKYLGIEPGKSGGMHKHISDRVRKAQIDTSHFLGLSNNRGSNHKGGPRRKSVNEILILRSDRQGETHTVRRAMIEIGIKYQCSECGQGPIWNNKPLVLQIDHIDGNNLNNLCENLRFLCPHCHTQTPTYGSLRLKKPSPTCKHCNKNLWPKNISGYCFKCLQIHKYAK